MKTRRGEVLFRRLAGSLVGKWKSRVLVLSIVLLSAMIGLRGMTLPAAQGSSVGPTAFPGQEQPAASVDAGETVYLDRCVACHGESGDGNGPVARFLDPRPRDFTLGMFKIRTTSSGEAPLDSDLIETVKRGMPGTSMPRWERTLSGEDIRNVVAYIKTFAPVIFDPAYPPQVVEVSQAPTTNAELISLGSEVYERAECGECHGDQGRADGESSDTLEDDWGYPILPRNLTKGSLYTRGSTIEDVYTRLSTGMDGTPMPSYLFDLDEDDRWAVAAYVASLVSEATDTSRVVLRATRVVGELPSDPDDPSWAEAPALDVLLAGQVIAWPRWENASVDQITVKAVHNGREVAFLLQWDDPFEDTVHEVAIGDDGGLEGTYVDRDVYGRTSHSYRDAVAVQFPEKLREGPRKPHFLWGSTGDPVNLWLWQADDGQVREMTAQGHSIKHEADADELSPTELMDRLLTPQSSESQDVTGLGVWNEGTWKVVMKRALDSAGPKDILFETGRLIPVAFQVWDGSNGERNLMMSISSWHYVLLETPTPLSTYLYSIGAVLIAAAVEIWLVRRLRRRVPPRIGVSQTDA